MGATWAWLFLASLSQLPGAAGAASSVKAFAEGYASGEVSTASSFLFGTASAFVTADPCIGIASGISLFRDDTAATGELHDIALWYSPNEALFHASVTRTLSSTREEVSAFTGSGWAAADPTLTGMELAIEWSAGSVRFMVDGVVIATTVPILGSLAAAPTLTFAPTEPEDVAAFAKPHSLHVFSIAARDPKPAAACLPSTSAFVGVKFTGAALNFEVTDWPANLASGAWIVGKGSDYRGSTPAFSPYAVLVPESVAGSGATLRITTGFTMYTSQEGADTDPDLLAYPDQPNATLWRVTADAHAAATAMVSPAAGGELIVSVSAAGVNESSITAGREMVVPAGEVLCSVARIRCDFARNVSMAVTARGTQAPSYFPAPVYTINTAPGAWQLFNTCYVFSAEETVEVIAWLGTYNAVTEYIYYRVEIDFLYTLRVALDTASDAWSGLRLVEKSWRLTENPTTPYYPWSGGTVENDAWTYTLINSNDFYQGEVQMVANAQGEGRLTRHALAISKGKTYRVSVTARMTNTDNANPRRVFVSMQSDLGTDTYGGIHQFVVTGVRTTFTYTFECLQSVQAVTLIVHMLPGFSGFSVGDVLVIVDVFLDEFNGNVTHPQDFKIEPTLAEREAGFPPFEGEPLSMGVVQPTSSYA
ncbi:hypothetical protein DIPPA_20228 [Diplonema papillatum]|nr:hypothetical protein DIPPA_20228 [Diplonema papillatum]